MMAQTGLMKLEQKLENKRNLMREISHFWDSMIKFGQKLISGPQWELPRDLFIILFSTYFMQVEKELSNDPVFVLKHVRDRAWLGYVDTPALIRRMCVDLPCSSDVQRLTNYFKEISNKRSSHLFLPVVSRIERHQAGHPIPLPLKLDAAQKEFGHISVAGIARKAFALAPQHKRERDAFLLALMGATWGKGDRGVVGLDLLAEVAEQLRLLYNKSEKSLGFMRSAANTNHTAACAVEMADQVSCADPTLWLETLFIVDYWRIGPQYFTNAIEVISKPIKKTF